MDDNNAYQRCVDAIFLYWSQSRPRGRFQNFLRIKSTEIPKYWFFDRFILIVVWDTNESHTSQKDLPTGILPTIGSDHDSIEVCTYRRNPMGIPSYNLTSLYPSIKMLIRTQIGWVILQASFSCLLRKKKSYTNWFDRCCWLLLIVAVVSPDCIFGEKNTSSWLLESFKIKSYLIFFVKTI